VDADDRWFEIGERAAMLLRGDFIAVDGIPPSLPARRSMDTSFSTPRHGGNGKLSWIVRVGYETLVPAQAYLALEIGRKCIG